ncbi:EAL domain-containing protein [uncultured Williamsia sp.]|uniref:EAL domain-containing protein n=1 Tax=uncultured Williamsia sp. TaxID=259311 RepID=UPI0026134B5D|nr:EAL domain-containing protein [uncultured Williamsia sp.]
MLHHRPTTSPARDEGLFHFLDGRQASSIRRYAAMLTIGTGLAGLTAWPSARGGPFSPAGWTVAVVALSAIPAAWLWFRQRHRRRADLLFVAYANCATTAVLLLLYPMFGAMPGVVLYGPIAFGALFLLGPGCFLANSAVGLGVLGVFVVGTAVEGAPIANIACRTLIVVTALAMPVGYWLYQRRLLTLVTSVQRDPVTGLFNRVGFEVAAAAADTGDVDSPIFVTASVQIHGDALLSGGKGARGVPAQVFATAGALRDITPYGGFTARTSATEFLVGIWVDGWDAASSTVEAMLSALDELAGVTGERNARWGCVVTAHNQEGSPTTTATWTVQRSIAAAEARRRDPDTRAHRDSGPEITFDDVRAVVDGAGPMIVFQPIVRAGDHAVLGYEALSRFPGHHASPQAWFRAAGELGLSVALETSAIHRALDAAQRLPASVFVSVNASPATLSSHRCREMLVAAASTRTVVVEISETALVSVDDEVQTALCVLRAAGILIAMDDVGAGYAGFRQLLAVSPDMIKVDSAITRGVDTDPARQAIARSMVEFARVTGARCVFEGVETRAELDTVTACGVEMVQGYLLGRPSQISASADRRRTQGAGDRSPGSA